jgi:hypothetical protein
MTSETSDLAISSTDAEVQEHAQLEADRAVMAAALQQKVLSIQDPKLRDEAQGKLNEALSNGGSLAGVESEIDQPLSQERDKDAQELQQKLGGSIMALAALGGFLHLGDVARKEGVALLGADMDTRVVALDNAAHHTPLVQPGQQISRMPSLGKGEGFSLSTRTSA